MGKFLRGDINEIHMGKFLRDIYFEQFVTEFPQMLSFKIILGKYVDEKSFEQTLIDEYN